jgi:hypothetical protein
MEGVGHEHWRMDTLTACSHVGRKFIAFISASSSA